MTVFDYSQKMNLKTPPTDMCRLCGARASYVFSLSLISRYNVSYYRCNSCKSLQTENPYWLSEAYKDPVRYTDTFTADRCIHMPRLTYAIAKIVGISTRCNVLDWGGGNGLMTRFMRDLGFDARNYDMYEKNTYAGGFDDEEEKQYEIVTCFEVLEHMANPREEISLLLARNPKIALLSTCFYEDQAKSWPYLAPYSGRHIFFYSTDGLKQFAKKKGYSSIAKENLIVFHNEPLSRLQSKLVKFALSSQGQRLISICLALFPPSGRIFEDWQEMRIKVNDNVRD